MKRTERYALDSFALLAYFEGESGAAEVEEILAACAAGEAKAWLSIINFGEILYIIEREQGLRSAQRAIAIIDQLSIHLVDADRARTFAAAHIKAHHALSYADAFVVSLAQELEATVVTGDPEFERVEKLVTVRWIGS